MSAASSAPTRLAVSPAPLDTGYGVGHKLRPRAYVVAAVLLFVTEAWVSHAWLARYRFGPLERLWRVLTYARLQPLPRVVAPVA
jgi:uncharacterized protein